MRLGPPYTEAEIRATPHEYDKPYEQTRRAKMWQARIDYWHRLSVISGAVFCVSLAVSLVSIVWLAAHR